MTEKIAISKTSLTSAIQNGLSYLQQAQLPSGEFPTYYSPDRPDLVGAEICFKSVYITTFIIHALTCLSPSLQIKQIQQQAANFLRSEQEDYGAWNYIGRGEHQLPDDLDDTCCALAALLQLGYRPDFSFYPLLWQNEVSPGGPYYTWIGINDPAHEHPYACEIDALVNANILFCAGLLNLALPGSVVYLKQVIKNESYQKENVYTLSAHFLIYTISRAYADGHITTLTSAMPVMQDYILNKLTHPKNEPVAFNLACLAVALLNLKAPLPLIEPYLTALLAQQHADGYWPTWAVYVQYNGAPALTTALALEAVGKYLQVKFLEAIYLLK